LVLRASAGLSRRVTDSSRAIIDLASYPYKIARVAKTRVPFVTNDLSKELEVDSAWVQKERLESAAIFPLAVGGALRGVLAAFFRFPLPEEVEEALLTFSSLVASALNDSFLHEAERASRKRFEDFVNGINHGIVWEADARTLRVTFVSAKAERLLGYPLDRWLSEPGFLLDHVHPNDLDYFSSRVAEAIKDKTDVGIDHRFIKADGEILWVHTGLRLAQMGPGAGTMVHALSSNVTHLKAAEARAATTARQLDTILRGVSDGITAQAPDGHLVYANETAARLSGSASVDELLSTTPSDRINRFEVLTENGAPYPLEALPGCLALRTGRSHEDTMLVRDGTGRAWWSVVSATPVLGTGGQVEMVINVFRDVTASKQNEHNLRLLAEASALLGASLDYEETLRKVADLTVPRLADWCAIQLGEASPPIVVAHADPEKRRRAAEVYRKYPPVRTTSPGPQNVLRTGVAELYEEIPDALLVRIAQNEDHLRMLRDVGMKSAMILPLAVRGRTFGALSLVTGDSGRRYTPADLAFATSLAERIAYAVENAKLYSQSVEARSLAEEARAEAETARTAAEEASRLKDEFLATVSHELRTPLSSILGWAAMLSSDRRMDPAWVHRAVEVIDRNAHSQLRIIEDILDVSRIVRGQLRIDTEPADLQAVIGEALEAVRPAAEAKRIEIEVKALEGPFRLIADKERLRQVFWNLLSNAVKFTPAEGRVTVMVGRSTGNLVIQVCDTGEGIDPSFLPYVFDRFRQADASFGRARGGLGLGLAIVRHLVEAHGGTVTVESAGVGRGAMFTVRLPVKPFTTTVPVTEANEAPVSNVPSHAAGALRGMRLLVVEDEPDSRELIELLLSSEGASVEGASSADDALARVATFRPDVLVSDIEMPVHDGYWLIREVRKSEPALPAVALTAYTRQQDAVRSRRAGFDEHVGKPVDPNRLVETIASLRPG
jgi:signal transduction histidine kinase/PAS domain-containing protein